MSTIRDVLQPSASWLSMRFAAFGWEYSYFVLS